MIRTRNGYHNVGGCYNFHYSAFLEFAKIIKNVCKLLKTLEPMIGLEPTT